MLEMCGSTGRTGVILDLHAAVSVCGSVCGQDTMTQDPSVVFKRLQLQIVASLSFSGDTFYSSILVTIFKSLSARLLGDERRSCQMKSSHFKGQLYINSLIFTSMHFKRAALTNRNCEGF